MSVIKSMSYVAVLTSAIQISEAGERFVFDAAASSQAGGKLIERISDSKLHENTNFVCDWEGCLPQDAGNFGDDVRKTLMKEGNYFFQAGKATIVGRACQVKRVDVAQIFPNGYRLPQTLINVTIASNTLNDVDYVKYGKLVVEALKAKKTTEMFMFAFRSDDKTRLGKLAEEAGMDIVMNDEGQRHRTTMEIGYGVSAEIMLAVFYGANYAQSTPDAQAAGDLVGKVLLNLWGGSQAPTYDQMMGKK